MEKTFTTLTKVQSALKWVGTSRRLWRTAFALLLVYGVMSPSTDISAPRVVDNANIMDDSEFALRSVRFLADDYTATKRKYANAIERLQKMGIEEQHLIQLADQAREKIETESAESRPKVRRQAVAKGAVGAGLMWLFPAWLAISVAAFTLAYELVPIRFRPPD